MLPFLPSSAIQAISPFQVVAKPHNNLFNITKQVKIKLTLLNHFLYLHFIRLRSVPCN